MGIKLKNSKKLNIPRKKKKNIFLICEFLICFIFTVVYPDLLGVIVLLGR